MKQWIALLLFLPALAGADDTSPALSPEPRQLAEQLLKFAVADDMDGLFKHMATMTQMEKAQLEDFRVNIAKQRKPALPKLGPALGYGFISECRRGDFLSRVIFAEKRAKSVMRWQFVFYRARDRWQIIYFFWDDKIPEFFASCT